MKFRLLAVMLLSTAALLSGCDIGTAGPTPSATVRAPLTLQPAPLETTDATRVGYFTEERTVNLPPGFGIKAYAAGLDDVRWLALSPHGVPYATVRGQGRVVALPDKDGDGVADEVKTFADGFEQLHGIAFKEDDVYVATEFQVIRLRDTDSDGVADERQVIIDDFPAGGNHKTRTIVFGPGPEGPKDKLYVSMGTECNACHDRDPRQAAVSVYSPDGTFEKIFVKGLRNAAGILFHPETSELWATNNGRDHLGDELPPDTVHRLQEGLDYGYPYCYGDRQPDASQEPPPGYCDNVARPDALLPAHSAPLGLAFYNGDRWPEEFRGDMFIGIHGSWNRSELRGYKVTRIRMKDGQVDTEAGDLMIEDFATGWLPPSLNVKEVWGRPVNPMVLPDGNMLLTDDYAGAIYYIYYEENAGP